ncbi:MAG: lysylphosphatidylglycerol synthase transmembrane domain-containing protein [Chloroflexota bacterium]
MNPPHSPRPRGWTARLIGTLATLGLLVYLLLRHWSEIGEALSKLGAGPALLGLGILSLSRLAVAGRWYVLLHGAEARVTPRQSLRLTYAGLFASNFLPTTIGGDVVRLAGGFALGIDRAVCAASLVVDRLVGVAGMTVALPFGLQALWSGAGALTGLKDAPLAAAVTVGWWTRARERVSAVGRRLLSALALWLWRPRSLAAALGLTWFHMLLLFGTLWMLLRAMGEPIPFIRLAGLWSLVYFVTLLPFSLNGLGLQELSLTFVLTNLGGVSMQAALALALVVRTLFMLASLPGALFLPGLLPGGHDESAGSEAG